MAAQGFHQSGVLSFVSFVSSFVVSPILGRELTNWILARFQSLELASTADGLDIFVPTFVLIFTFVVSFVLLKKTLLAIATRFTDYWRLIGVYAELYTIGNSIGIAPFAVYYSFWKEGIVVSGRARTSTYTDMGLEHKFLEKWTSRNLVYLRDPDETGSQIAYLYESQPGGEGSTFQLGITIQTLNDKEGDGCFIGLGRTSKDMKEFILSRRGGTKSSKGQLAAAINDGEIVPKVDFYFQEIDGPFVRKELSLLRTLTRNSAARSFAASVDLSRQMQGALWDKSIVETSGDLSEMFASKTSEKEWKQEFSKRLSLVRPKDGLGETNE